MDIANLINTFGFPTACVIACGFFIWKMEEQQIKDKEQLYTELEKSRETTNKATETTNNATLATSKALDTIKLYADKLDIIESDVKEIKEKVVG
ncbi:MAG: hypothetical protein AB7E42_02625 [Anaerotignaceae bacterium]